MPRRAAWASVPARLHPPAVRHAVGLRAHSLVAAQAVPCLVGQLGLEAAAKLLAPRPPVALVAPRQVAPPAAGAHGGAGRPRLPRVLPPRLVHDPCAEALCG